MFTAGTRVRFFTVFGECVGTVVAVTDEAIGGDYVHRVQPDDGTLPAVILLGRSLSLLDDEPLIVMAEKRSQ